jgi:hypothetical protein
MEHERFRRTFDTGVSPGPPVTDGQVERRDRMSTVTNGPATRATVTPPSSYPVSERAPEGEGWVVFAGLMLVIAATLNIIWGIAAIAESGFFVAGANFILLADLTTWGWIVLAFGALELLAALSVWRGGGFGRWFGIFAASLALIAALMSMPAYPFWSLTLVAMCVLVIYGLAAYGGNPEL